MNVVFVDFAQQNQQKPRSLTFDAAAGGETTTSKRNRR